MRGVVGIAVPVFDFRGEIRGALAVAGPVDRIPVHENDQAALAALVVAAANQISYELGRLGPGRQ